ncbi:hypothetical protein [Alkalicoccus halolimnae]|uniref:OsmC family protein n=1 Tax=Alkalicoccus halolimnae TaxID=1667239 RepID=A0AAJ8N3H1_9BACI
MSGKMRFEVSGKAKNMTAELQAKNHTIIIDEPAEMGGADKGQDPLSNMLASLAGCENVIANMVAKEMMFRFKQV